MVKGCQRKIVVLKDTGSDLFEEAYFILKEEHSGGEASIPPDMAEEADRILSGNLSAPKKPRTGGRRPVSGLRWFLYGALLAGSLVTAVFTAVFCF